MELDDASDHIVDRAAPKLLQEWAHPMPHGDGPWTNQLNIDISVIHEFEMTLLGIFKLFVGHLQFSAWRILRHRLSEKLTKRRGCGHVTVNIYDFLTVMHRASSTFCLWIQGLRIQTFNFLLPTLNLELLNL